MPEGKRSRRLEEVSHLYLSSRDPDRTCEGTRSVIDLCVTGERFLRGFIAAGLSSVLASADLNITLIETGLSLPNAGYYFGLEAGVYLGPALGRSECIDLMWSTSFRYVYSFRPAGLPDTEAGFAFPGNPHVLINVFDNTGLSSSGTIPGELTDIPAGFIRDGVNGARRGLILFAGREPGTDPARIVSSFTNDTGSSAVLIASDRAEADEIIEIPDVEVGMIEPPDYLGRTMATRMPPHGSFFNALAARMMRMTRGQEGEMPNAATQR